MFYEMSDLKTEWLACVNFLWNNLLKPVRIVWIFYELGKWLKNWMTDLFQFPNIKQKSKLTYPLTDLLKFS
jgi:hypothetical protein